MGHWRGWSGLHAQGWGGTEPGLAAQPLPLFPGVPRCLPWGKVEAAVGTPSSSWPGGKPVPLYLAGTGARPPHPQGGVSRRPALAGLAAPGGAPGPPPGTLGWPHWCLEPGEPLTALVLLAEEALPACLEMSGRWGGGHCSAPHPPTPPLEDAGPQAALVMEPGPTAECGRAQWGLLGCSGWGRGGRPPGGRLMDKGLSWASLQP